MSAQGCFDFPRSRRLALSPFSQGEAGQAINLPQSEEKWQQNWLCAPHRADSGKINVYIERSDLCTWQLACLQPLRTPTGFSEHSAFHVHIWLDEESQCRTWPWLQPSKLHINDWCTHVFTECHERLTFLPGRHLWLSKRWEAFKEKRPQCFSHLPPRVQWTPSYSQEICSRDGDLLSPENLRGRNGFLLLRRDHLNYSLPPKKNKFREEAKANSWTLHF